MHDSGASAVARAVDRLGFRVDGRESRTPPGSEHPKGLRESSALRAFDDELLDFLGGSWAAPPRLDEGWQADARLDPYREKACALFEAEGDGGLWVWNEARNCLLLPFWMAVLDERPRVVLVHRHPLEIADSLRRREGFSATLSLALWERYLRSILADLRGFEVAVVRYADTLDRPSEVSALLREFLDVGTENDAPPILDLTDGAHRRSFCSQRDLEESREVSVEQCCLFRLIESRVGLHREIDVPDLGVETQSTEGLLAERRRGDVLAARRVRELRDAHDEILHLRTENAELAGGLQEARLPGAEAERSASRSGERVALLLRESDALTAEILDLQGEISSTREATHKIHSKALHKVHSEVLRRQELIEAMEQTRIWWIRSRLRHLVRGGRR